MLRNESGMAMFFVLVIGAIVTLTGITLWQVSTTDVIQVGRDEDGARAYQYAKAGVEIAIGNIIQNGPGYLLGQEDPIRFYGSLDREYFSDLPDEPPGHTIELEIQRENNNFLIKSTGIVRTGNAERARETITFTIDADDLYSSSMPPLDMIFALENIRLSDPYGGGSSEIHGDTGTNAAAANSVVFSYSTKIIDGDLYIGPGSDWDKDNVVIFNGYDRGPDTNIPDGDIYNLPFARSYPLPEFPEFPADTELGYKGEINAGWNQDDYRISKSGSYSSINVQKCLTFDIGDRDVIIKTKDLIVSGIGEIVLNRTGSGRLILYVEDSFRLEGSSKINHGGSYDDIYMYYLGDGFVVGGVTEFQGSVYALNSDFTIFSSGVVNGHIITGGDNVEITGNSKVNVRAIYAPNAAVNIAGSGSVRGAIVARTIGMQGNARIYYDDSMDMTFFEQLAWDSGRGGFKNWWEKGRWNNL